MSEEEIIKRVRMSLAALKTREEIYGELLGDGVSIKQIEQAFRGVSGYLDPKAGIPGALAQSLPQSQSQATTAAHLSTPPSRAEASLLGAQDTAAREEAGSRLFMVVTSIATILIVAGLLSFIWSYWGTMSDMTKIAITGALMLVFYGMGWYMREVKGMIIPGTAVLVVAITLFGLLTVLVSRVFNINLEMPAVLLVWYLGGLGVAYALESKFLYFATLPLLAFSLFMYPVIMAMRMLRGSEELLATIALIAFAMFAVLWLSVRMRRTMPAELSRLF